MLGEHGWKSYVLGFYISISAPGDEFSMGNLCVSLLSYAIVSTYLLK